MKKFFIAIIFLAVFTNTLFATHNKSGEITYTWVSGTTYNITVTTYTKESSSADRCSLLIFFGDGDSCVAGRTNGSMTSTTSSGYNLDCTPYGTGVVMENDTKINTYTCSHTYAGPGSYWISMEDPNRNNGIDNIPNSANVVFYIRALLVINNLLGSGHNNSAVLLNPPVDYACISNCLTYNCAAYDPDGDSLSYELITCLGDSGLAIPGYTLPPATDSIYINSHTGDFIWCKPTVLGQYNIAILIHEWRSGYEIGNVERDMQIIVSACNDTPPSFASLNDTAVVAGQTISFNVKATDSDANNVTLSAIGEPLTAGATSPLATFPNGLGGSTISSVFSWSPVNSQVRNQPYAVYFKATDDFPTTPLTNYKTIHIMVLPAPTGIAGVVDNALFTVYPNPFNSTLQFTLPPKQGQLSVFNILGEIVYSETIPANTNNLKLDLSFLSNGLYHISFVNSTGNYTARIVKN